MRLTDGVRCMHEGVMLIFLPSKQLQLTGGVLPKVLARYWLLGSVSFRLLLACLPLYLLVAIFGTYLLLYLFATVLGTYLLLYLALVTFL